MNTRPLRVTIAGADVERLSLAAQAMGSLPGVRPIFRRWPIGRYQLMGRPDVLVVVTDLEQHPADLRLIANVASRHPVVLLGKASPKVDSQFARAIGAKSYCGDTVCLARELSSAVAGHTVPWHQRRLVSFAPEAISVLGVLLALALPIQVPARLGAALAAMLLGLLILLRQWRQREASLAMVCDAVRDYTRIREHARYSRMLHDHVLQTLEMLSRPESALDSMMRDQVRRDATWLRGLLERGPTQAPATASAELSKLVTEYAEGPLRVSLSSSARAWPDLSPDQVQALCGATREALRNVRKHASTDKAEVIARLRADGVELRIRDYGVGFDTVRRREGFGLAESIHDRLSEVGGSAQIQSALGHGTLVRLFVPARTG